MTRRLARVLVLLLLCALLLPATSVPVAAQVPSEPGAAATLDAVEATPAALPAPRPELAALPPDGEEATPGCRRRQSHLCSDRRGRRQVLG